MKIINILLLTLLLISCNDAGKSNAILSGNEQELPDELKGLKVYEVSTGNLSSIKVAVVDNKIIRTITYRENKHDRVVAIVDNSKVDTIIATSIVMENDSLILLKK